MKHSIDELPKRGEKVWFIIRQDSHEGPYPFDLLLEKLAARELQLKSSVWARGWPNSLELGVVVEAYGQLENEIAPPEITLPEQSEAAPQEMRVPRVVESAPALQVEPLVFDERPEVVPERTSHSRWPWVAGVLLVCGIGAWGVQKLTPRAELLRPAEMSLETYRRMKEAFEKLDKPLPVPAVAVAADYSKLWLLDRATQSCRYEASFYSAETMNLGGQKISFQSSASGLSHWILLERLSFSEGQKLMPGRYQLNLVRQGCTPAGITQFWEKPLADMSVAFEVEIYAGPISELAERLAVLAKKKALEDGRRIEEARQAWRDIEEKLRTLSAISMQIELSFGDLLNRKLAWKPRLARFVEQYTMRFGGFLTNFTVKSEEDFNAIALREIPDKVELMARGPAINAYAKRIGFLSMSLIEKLQKDPEAPKRSDLQDWIRTLQQDFGVEREKLRLAVEEASLRAKSEALGKDPATPASTESP
jgi:hypothetical protein